MVKKRKHIRQSTFPINSTNWGYPKQERLRAMVIDLNILHGYGAPVVVREPCIDRDSRKSGSGNAAHMAKGRSCCVPKSKLIREENLNATNDRDFGKNQAELSK